MTWKLAQGLSVGYKKRPIATVTEQILFEAGQVSLLLGLNGQGKTTLMKTLAGLLPPLAGSLALTDVLYLSDDVDFPANLTPRDIVKCLDPGRKFRALGSEMLAGLAIENRRYSLLSKGKPRRSGCAPGLALSSGSASLRQSLARCSDRTICEGSGKAWASKTSGTF